MFYHLLYPLASDISFFNVFRYITFRTGAATLTALFISFLVGPALIRALAHRLVLFRAVRREQDHPSPRPAPPGAVRLSVVVPEIGRAHV